tara:strand:+ start:43 stop:420 length:378 start_codon:yes stop_codon:yes gene_type:complete
MSNNIYTPSPNDEIFSYPKLDIDWGDEDLVLQHPTQDQWGSNNPNWGNHQPQSKEHKAKRAKAKCREIEIEGVLYSSGVAAAKILNYGVGTISNWATKNGSRYGITIPIGSNQWINRHGKNNTTD